MHLTQSGVHCSSKMTVWWLAVMLLCCTLNCADSAPSPVPLRNKYNNSFRLTRSTRTRVQQLLNRYKVEELRDQPVDRSRKLKDLPLLSTDFCNWLKLTDWERLHAAFQDLKAYWEMLEKQLKGKNRAQRVLRSTLPQSIRHIQLDLRDLMSQVSSQMSYMRSSWMKPISPTVRTPSDPDPTPKIEWDSRVEGYIILRDLDLYLTKLARDFLLLASKTHL